MKDLVLKGELTEEKAEAYRLHQNIVLSMRQAAGAMVEVCRRLKQMRDKRLYVALGYETLEAYTEDALGIKQRQAYNYIQTYEALGDRLLEDNADIGITKLQLLAQVSAPDRAAFARDNDLAGLTAEEVKALVQKTEQQGEQISFLQEELIKRAEEKDGLEIQADRSQMAQKETAEELERLRAELEALKKEPVETTAAALPEEEALEAARREERTKALAVLEAEKKKATEAARKEERAKQQAKIEKELEKAREEGKRKGCEAAAADYRRHLELLAGEKEQLAEDLKKAEETASLAQDPVTAAYRVHFGIVQEDFERCMRDLAEMDEKGTDSGKYRAAMIKLLDMLREKVNNENDCLTN